MVYISDDNLERFIKEDVPYIDLTTIMLGIAGKKGRISFVCRDPAVICGTEEALRIMGKLNLNPLFHLPSGSAVKPGTVILEAESRAENLHLAWKPAQNILEYLSGIATRTAAILARAQEGNPHIQLLSTRKVFPGTKELAIKAVIAGGGMPHRLGLSETILVFEQHWAFLEGYGQLLDKLRQLKKQKLEKKIIVEVNSLDQAIQVCQAGADGVQFDKMPYPDLALAVARLRAVKPELLILGAGGINAENAADYAATGIDAIVTTAVYYGKPANIGVTMTPVND